MNDQTIEIMKLMNFCKYLSDSQSVIRGIFESQKIRFTQPAALNDPLELNPSIKYPHINKQYTKYSLDGILLPSGDDYFRKTYIIDRINNYGILSLTRIPDSFSMWNFYSNGHKGAALVFKVDFNKHSCMLSPTGEKYPLKKVTYDDEYQFNLADVSPNDRDEIPMEEISNKFFFKKTSRWVDEQEWRMVRPIYGRDDFDINELQKIYLFDISLDCIESIIFGAKMSVENKIHIQNCCRNYQLSFLQAVIIQNEKGKDGRAGKIVLIPEDSFKPNSPIFQMEPNSCILDKEQISHKETLPIKEISEHPFFEDDKEYFLNFYKQKLRKQNT